MDLCNTVPHDWSVLSKYFAATVHHEKGGWHVSGGCIVGWWFDLVLTWLMAGGGRGVKKLKSLGGGGN